MLKRILFLGLVISVFLLYSCKDSLTDHPEGNKPPTTQAFVLDTAANKITTQQSKIKVSWSGDDPDGLIVGFYFTWNGKDWTFTTKNDSLFSLKIGALDSTFIFKVSAVDNSGNGIYDEHVIQNGIDYGPESFIDSTSLGAKAAGYKNGKWDQGEPFTDIGIIDPKPATVRVPIKNTSPEIKWNILSTAPPDTAYPVMSFGWDVKDMDGDETIDQIQIALNNTSKYVSLKGNVRSVTLRVKSISDAQPKMEILIDRKSYSVSPALLDSFKYNQKNVFYVRAVDISGAASPWLNSDTSKWYAKQPKGRFLIIDDYSLNDNAASFYNSMFNDSLNLRGQFDVFEVAKQVLPYKSDTFLETLKLFKCAFWYSDYSIPSLDLASFTVDTYLASGGKIFFSMQFPINANMATIIGFLPVQPDEIVATILKPGAVIGLDSNVTGFPTLTTSSQIPRIRTFKLATTGVKSIYYFPDGQLKESVGFESTAKNLFFIGLPLNFCNATPGSVKTLLNKVFFEEFQL